MDDDERLEDDGPCRVPETLLKRTKDLCDTGFTRVRRNENVFDIFGLGRSQLFLISVYTGP